MNVFITSLVNDAVGAPQLVLGIIGTTVLVLFVPWQSNFKPLDALLNSAEDKKDSLTKVWREQKLSELTYVGVAVRPFPLNSWSSWPNLLQVRHPREHCHRRNRLASRPFIFWTSLGHESELVLQPDSRPHSN
jgi:hypothetical protein